MRLRLTLAAVLLCLTSVAAKADSITLTSASNGTYQYSFTQNNNPGGFEYYSQGSSFVLSGFSGITGVRAFAASFFDITFTSTSATFTFKSDAAFGASTFLNFFTLTSTVLTAGVGAFSIPSTPTQTGALAGPVSTAAVTAATPEPSSFALLGTGMLGVIGAVRRRMA